VRTPKESEQVKALTNLQPERETSKDTKYKLQSKVHLHPIKQRQGQVRTLIENK
jgi:hypothetical protein